jgi:hypothetical protein
MGCAVVGKVPVAARWQGARHAVSVRPVIPFHVTRIRIRTGNCRKIIQPILVPCCTASWKSLGLMNNGS